MSLPPVYPDNTTLLASQTVVIRDNNVSDCTSNLPITGLEVIWGQAARIKNNSIARMNVKTGGSYGVTCSGCSNLLLQYNAVSRCHIGYKFDLVNTLNVYNATAHNCGYGVGTSVSGTFKNLALSAGVNTKYYKNSIGFLLENNAIVDLDYSYYFNLAQLGTGLGTLDTGSVVLEKEILYLDEQNNDLTPDHISELVNAGTTNPLGETSPSIGGVASEVLSTETTPNRKYHYDLLDNSFWDVDNPKAVEIAFIKAMQSRILANCELANKSVADNTYIKYASSLTRFTELYPMYARYCNAARFKKRAMDLWYAGQNVGTIQAYQNAIGGYNLLPSFFKRMEDTEGCWVINESYIDIDNYLLGTDEQKFGIAIDVLGLSTLTLSTSGECYRNVMNSVADIAPVYWITHDEVQPSGYVVFAEKYNGFENCTLDNMVYSDEYTIVVNELGQASQLVTPLLPLTPALAYTEGLATSGQVEVSILDRVYSEVIDRKAYYRLGNAEDTMGAWNLMNKVVGEVVTAGSLNLYIQFKIVVEDVIRLIDYEFVSLAYRGHRSSRVWDFEY